MSGNFVFLEACKWRKSELVKFIIDNYKDEINIVDILNHDDYYSNIFVHICNVGNLDVIKIILDNFADKINKHIVNIGFIYACFNNKLRVSKYLFKNLNNIIDITYKYNAAFRGACEKGYLDIVKWLWKKGENKDGTNKINISISEYILYRIGYINVNNEHGFISACNNKHYEVIKYLWEVGKNADGSHKLGKY